MHLPKLQIDHAATSTAPGLLFLGEKGGKSKPSDAVIADNQGRVVWEYEAPNGLEITDFRAQAYRGKPVLTWWQGTISKAGVGTGSYLVYDAAYRKIASVKAGHDLAGDLHEFQLTPRGTAFLSVYREVPYDLSGVGGPKHGFAYDSVVQEVNVATRKVVFEWHSLDHVGLSESLQANQEPALHASDKRPFDYFHVNSIADGPDGTILISGRNTSALYLIRRDGSIAWRLGGKRSDFTIVPGAEFSFQHDVRRHADGTLTIFDNNAADPASTAPARPIRLALDMGAMTATLVREYRPANPPTAWAMGNVEQLPDGGVFVGWGTAGSFTEFAPDGTVRFDAALADGSSTYRAFRASWVGKPTELPRVAVTRDSRGAVAHVSWNGATEVATWRADLGSYGKPFRPVAAAPRSAFETTLRLGHRTGLLAVTALDAAGKALGRSAVHWLV